MHSTIIEFDDYPEWYRVEKETEKTIKKLTTIKEFGPYLGNSNEFIRRLAVLRINELKLKDAVIPLKELLDDPLETVSNKEIAAWTIKVIILHWNTDFFITNKYLSKYSGKEKYNDIFRINIKDSLPSLKFDFTSSMFNKELAMENNEIRNSKEIDIDLPFSVKEWFAQYSSDILNDLKKLLIRLPVVVFKAVKTIALLAFSGVCQGSKLLLEKLSSIRQKRKIRKNSKSEASENTSSTASGFGAGYKHISSQPTEIQSLRSTYNKSAFFENEITEKISLAERAKKLIFNIFYVVFFPVRFVIKRKAAIIVMLIALYCFFTYTTAGKILVYRNTGLDLMEEQTKILGASKEILTYAWDEIQEFCGISDSLAQDEGAPYENDATPPLEAPLISYRILAKNGLNVREQPDKSANVLQKLDYNQVVLYYGKALDSSTTAWFKIETADGTIGWVASEYLEQIGGHENGWH